MSLWKREWKLRRSGYMSAILPSELPLPAVKKHCGRRTFSPIIICELSSPTRTGGTGRRSISSELRTLLLLLLPFRQVRHSVQVLMAYFKMRGHAQSICRLFYVRRGEKEKLCGI